ncbi:L-serine dehydratase [Emiliania huxleyi CCMP1516]|uniref:L-serine ammonia-lyase n=4 Tax=Emiliania huxleyi TaxID=2903 RepID=A0A0D3KIA0_EMIH1|nr:L-serine dehydratase [Emiliania huxleyi CCMP1516]EOD35485.1 L-serine dehydratase [Emiliania huxleyi CCMP1516]|eukprot:XP_005787914.1 L-serine dehydratase [Emiliania huxleyi CCMP1516]
MAVLFSLPLSTLRPRTTLRPLATLARAAPIVPAIKLPHGLTHQTPLVESLPLSAATGCQVLLKMDALQPSGSFKDRGMAYMCAALQSRGVTDLISSSGGNAGLAASAAGRKLGMRVRVVVPTTTKPIMIEKMRAHGAEVEVHGANWNAADELARELVGASGGAAAYVPPYDDPLLWEGHSHGWSETTVLTAETDGAACFAKALAAGEPVTLAGITSGPLTCRRAVRLELGRPDGARRPADGGAQGSRERGADGWQRCHVAYTVSDAEAVGACASLLDDHRVLVEPACGAALALAYSPRQREALRRFETVVVVVCGGGGVTHEILSQWKADLL